MLLTPEGKVSRYFFGIEYPPRDLRLGLVEASGDQIGGLVDQVLLYCFHYDPVIGRYSAITLNIMRGPPRDRRRPRPLHRAPAAAGDRSARALGSRLT